MEISGLHGGRSRVEFDWVEEPDACCDCRVQPYEVDGQMVWDCDYCGGGRADLMPAPLFRRPLDRRKEIGMRDLADIGGYEADCGENKPKAEIVSESGHYCVMVGNNCIARYDQQSDDCAYTNARKAEEKWNAEA